MTGEAWADAGAMIGAPQVAAELRADMEHIMAFVNIEGRQTRRGRIVYRTLVEQLGVRYTNRQACRHHPEAEKHKKTNKHN